MFERVILPLDGSKTGEMVLPYAYEIAAKAGKEIVLAGVCEDDTDKYRIYVSYLSSLSEEIMSSLQSYGIKEKLLVKSEILKGNPADEIIRYAQENTNNLLVMSSHGYTDVQPPFIGNVVNKVLSKIYNPVVLIKKPVDSKVYERGNLIKRMLVPLDGSGLGEGIIPYAARMAESMNADISLFNAMYPWGLGLGEVGPTYEEEEARKAKVISYLDKVGEDFRNRGINTDCVAITGFAGQEIVAYADGKNADLIAMTTHGRTGLLRYVFGSVAYKVIHSGDTPVLLVRSKS